jgi:prepilin-type N-terminal cleavage/methylation domain-containing protein
MCRSRGFTLIELLVVIAIIAILAAILFPVFAQAKAAAKKTASLSNTKQTATAHIMYAGDNEDNFPLSYPFDENGTMISGPTRPSLQYFNALVPADAKVWDKAPLEYIQYSQTAWANSIQPYMKSVELLDTPMSVAHNDAFYQALTSRPLSSLPNTHMSMNGLLNGYSASAINAPSQVPLLGFGNGKEAYNGRMYTNPYMRCRVLGTAASPAPPCRFNAGGAPQSTDTMGTSTRADTYEFSYEGSLDTTWTHGEGTIFAYTDSSAKFVKTPRSGTNTGSRAHAGYIYTDTPAGHLDTPARCVAGSTGIPYMSFYRPDSTGAYELGSTAMRMPCNN